MEYLKLFINGKWVPPSSDKYFDAISPSTNELIGKIPSASREDAAKAVESAYKAKKVIQSMSVFERANLLRNIAEEIGSKKEQLAHTLTLDQGKPFYSESIKEVESVIRGFQEASEQIKWLETSVISTQDLHKKAFTILQPKGVYAVITPWNFPLMVPTEFIAPGLAAGNTIVWVPAPSTSLISIKLAECFEAAGVPAGVINLVTGSGDTVGDEIVIHQKTDAIAFCGSTKTGDIIAKRGASKPQLLELGGNGPTVVLKDADIEHAAKTIAKGCFTNAGQICSATERILVHNSMHDQLAEKLVSEAKKIKLGDPFLKETTMGPLNNYPVLKKNIEHAENSRERGSNFLIGGTKATNQSSELYFEPTVITDVKKESLYNLDETFGPVAPIFSFATEEEAFELVYSSQWGLASSIYTKELKSAMKWAEALPTGLVNINENSNYWEPHIPFGGRTGKSSGKGRVGGQYAIKEMSDLKTITLDLH